jgi:hypothetical protein
MSTKFISAGLIVVLPLAVLCPSAQAATLTNNFDVPHNYFANGIIGDTNWDGVYLGFGDLPGATPAEAEVAPPLRRTPA